MKRLFYAILAFLGFAVFAACGSGGEMPEVYENRGEVEERAYLIFPTPDEPVANFPNEPQSWRDYHENNMPQPPADWTLPIRPSVIAAGNHISAYIAEDGGLYVWGNLPFEEEIGEEYDYRRTPRRIMDDVVAIHTVVRHATYMNDHLYAINSQGELWRHRATFYNGEPTGEYALELMFTDVTDFVHGHVFAALGTDGTAKILNVSNRTSALYVSMDYQSWGVLLQGYLQIGRLRALAVSGLTYGFFEVIEQWHLASTPANSFHHFFGITYNGELWGWGARTLDNVAFVSEGEGPVFSPIHIMDDVAQIAAATQFQMALTNDGRLYTWGNSRGGELGHGNRSRITTPTFLMDNVAYIYARNGSALAVTTDGTLYIWGQMVNNSNTPQAFLNNVAAATFGEGHLLAVTNDGALWGAGMNNAGQVDANNPNLNISEMTRLFGGVMLP